MPAAYLFDMDGLLLDTERLTMEGFLDCAPLVQRDAAEMRAFFTTLVGLTARRSQHLMTEFCGPEADLEAISAHWERSCERRLADGVPIKPTVADTLAGLSGQGVQMAVVTSTDGARARHHLERAGLLAHFSFVLGGDEVSATKPDPAPYLEAAARFGFDPKLCAAFEDSDHGLTAAATAGCFAVQIPDLRPPGRPFPQLGQAFASTLQDAVTHAQGHFQQRCRASAPSV
ncbi:HAD family phosphatase [Tritonibacter scottomollicae]|uniref:HAD family phosphatase n=1 Tax=Tritonibacter scottomollicae TaxID=483013 RepID=A0ABZ0HGS8_TRISK|nr:HAD family phosphatase [Tritonibacter scottomollicae]WOI34028.1 HAD family phosphatase [Tritonibacter scottomollicae]